MVNTDKYRNLLGDPKESDPPGLYNAIQMIGILCDELDAARAELADKRQDYSDCFRDMNAAEAICEDLQARLDAVTAQLANEKRLHNETVTEFLHYRTRLDAVTNLCDEALYVSPTFVAKVRTAATGDTK